MFKKISAILLIAIMIFSATACNVTRVDDGKSDGATGFEYVTFRWGNAYYADYYPNNINASTTIGDALLARYKYMEEDLGMEFIVEDMDNGTEEILQRLAISQNVPDIFMGTSRKVAWPLYLENQLYSLDEIETIDHTSEKWGAKNFIQCAKFDGREFGFFPWEWAYVPSYSGVMVFNVDVINNAGATLPYEYQEQKIWNWSSLEDTLEIVKAAMSGDTVAPWVTNSLNDDAFHALIGNGIDAVVDDPVNGGYAFGFDSNEGIETLNWLNGLYVDGLYGTGGSAAFIEGVPAFYSGALSAATSTTGKENADGTTAATIATSVNRYGVVSFPYGPNADHTRVSANVYWSTPMNFILNNSENDAATIGLIMEELFAPLDDVLGWQDHLIENILHDEKDYENIMYMFEHCNYDYSVQLFETAGELDTVFKAAIIGEMSAAGAFEAVRDLAKDEIDTNIQTLD